jgi:hypothetical protein
MVERRACSPSVRSPSSARATLPAGVWRYTKPIVAAASAVLVLWQSLASNGMVPAEWIQLVLAALGALGVLAAPGPKVEQVGRHAA